MKLYTSRKTAKKLGLHPNTLRRWADDGKIKTIKTAAGQRFHFKRKELNAILERAMHGDDVRLVVAHRDRLARFGADLVRFISETNGGKLVVFSEDSLSPEQELTRDLLNIIHGFSCRMHGLRKYKKQVYQIISDGNTTETL
jgi:putative resolvase